MGPGRALRTVSALCVAAVAAVAGCGGGSDDPEPTGGTPAAGSETPAAEIRDNVARVGGLSPPDVAAAAVLAAYPPEKERAPNGWLLVAHQRWHDAVLSAEFAAEPVRAGLLGIERDYLPPAPSDAVRRLRPKGFPRGSGLQAMVLGKAGNDVFLELDERGLKATKLDAPTPAQLSAKLVPFQGGWAHKYSDTVVAVSSKERDYALPAAAWSAYSGDSIAFVDPDGVPAATRRLLVQRKKLRIDKPTIYVIGPEEVVSDEVMGELAAYGKVKRVSGRDAVETAVALARYRDASTGFGWGMRRNPGSISLVNVDDWGNALGAFTLAGVGPQAPLLLTTDADELPKPVVSYLRGLRGRRPSQGFVLGDERSISSATLSRLDRALEPR